jgi:hypothetical protein
VTTNRVPSEASIDKLEIAAIICIVTFESPARSRTVKNNPGGETTMGAELLREIQNWKLEAKLEDSERYFFEVAEVDSIRSGHKSYVIGRKGTGKTAIGERFLVREHKDNAHSTKLSFKNFPFNELYNNKDTIFTRPNQFITVWKYIIYMTICRLMRDNPKVNYSARAYCEKLIPANDVTSIARLIPR